MGGAVSIPNNHGGESEEYVKVVCEILEAAPSVELSEEEKTNMATNLKAKYEELKAANTSEEEIQQQMKT